MSIFEVDALGNKASVGDCNKKVLQSHSMAIKYCVVADVKDFASCHGVINASRETYVLAEANGRRFTRAAGLRML